MYLFIRPPSSSSDSSDEKTSPTAMAFFSSSFKMLRNSSSWAQTVGVVLTVGVAQTVGGSYFSNWFTDRLSDGNLDPEKNI